MNNSSFAVRIPSSNNDRKGVLKSALMKLILEYGLQATIRALGVEAGEIAEHARTCKIPECDIHTQGVKRWEQASKYLYDRASRAPSVEDL